MDIFMTAIQADGGGRPTRLYGTLNGTAAELQELRDVIDRALTDGPAVMEVASSSGAIVRLIVDRLGAPLTVAVVRGN